MSRAMASAWLCWSLRYRPSTGPSPRTGRPWSLMGIPSAELIRLVGAVSKRCAWMAPVLHAARERLCTCLK